MSKATIVKVHSLRSACYKLQGYFIIEKNSDELDVTGNSFSLPGITEFDKRTTMGKPIDVSLI